MFLKGTILPMTKSDQQRITQHKRFAIAHPNPFNARLVPAKAVRGISP